MTILSLIILMAAAAPDDPTQEPCPVPVPHDTGKVPPTVECFSGPSVPVPAAFVAARDSSRQWFADAYLDAGKLGAPLAKAIPFKPGEGGVSPYLAHGSFLLALPHEELPKPIAVRLLISSQSDGGERKAAGSILVRITPRDFLKDILEARRSDLERPLDIIVFGPDPGLRELLAAWAIPFHDNGPNPPGSAPPATLLLGETPDLLQLPAPTPGASAFVLTTDTRLDAESETRDAGGARFTIVRSAGSDWKGDPRLHRLLAAHCTSRQGNPVSPQTTPTNQPRAPKQ